MTKHRLEEVELDPAILPRAHETTHQLDAVVSFLSQACVELPLHLRPRREIHGRRLPDQPA